MISTVSEPPIQHSQNMDIPLVDQEPTIISPVGSPGSRSTRSATSAGSGESFETGSSKRFKHYQHPTVADSPVLLQVCETCIENNDHDGLAAIAHSKGLPPNLRAQAWPLLLKNHPYVQNPHVVVDFPSTAMIPTNRVPEKRIAGDLSRLVRRVEKSPSERTDRSSDRSSERTSSTGAQSHDTGSSTSASSSVSSGSSMSDFTPNKVSQVVQDSIFSAVKVFLEKWGDKVMYESALVWIGYYLSQAMGNIPVDAEVFEHAMLVFCHAPEERESDAAHPRGPTDSLSAGAISNFIARLRIFLPALSGHFDQEYMLSFGESEEWLLWWIKWFGVKAFRVQDTARLWDVYFSWRRPSKPVELGKNETVEAIAPSDPGPRTRHLFCCLGMLKANQFKLMELDQSEMRQMLSRSPATNMELVTEASADMYVQYRQRVQTVLANDNPINQSNETTPLAETSKETAWKPLD